MGTDDALVAVLADKFAEYRPHNPCPRLGGGAITPARGPVVAPLPR